MTCFRVVFVGLVLLAELAAADEPLLRPNDRVALLGGTFVERLQDFGALEAELQCRRPEWKLSVRNLGWSGDDVHGMARKLFDPQPHGFERLMTDVETADPTVVLVMYGFAEASNGAEAVKQFEPGLRKLVSRLRTSKRRVILIEPVVMPGYRVKGYEAWLGQCRTTVNRIGNETDAPVVAVAWEPGAGEVVASGLLPNSDGYAKYAAAVCGRLVGAGECGGSDEELRDLIVAKNRLFFHRYRPQNETYLYLFRQREQGNNAVEVPQFDPLVTQADQEIWNAAK